jgi:hypothetical protein
MKQIVAVVLIIVLTAPPVLAGQKQLKPIDWQELKPGTKIVLTITGGQSMNERVLFVNESVLVTRKAAPPKLPEQVEKALLDVGSYWPAVFDVGVTGKSGRVRVSPDGVFDGDKKLADLTAVVRYTPRGEVLKVSKAPSSNLGYYILIGIAAFFVIVGLMSPNT